MKKFDILRTSARLFATQGFDATTTIQMATESGVTEPLIYYHFSGKDEVFTTIIQNAFARYFEAIAGLDPKPPTQFDRIANLIGLHFDIVDEIPHEISLVISVCPAKLNDPAGVCMKGVVEQRDRLTRYLTSSLKKGIKTGEFEKVPIPATVDMFLGLINGMMRRRALNLEQTKRVKQATIEFCRRALVR